MPARSEAGAPAARKILTALECGRATCACHVSARRGHGVTHCPVPGHGQGHGDRGPSLQVTGGRDKPLFKCFAGCQSADVVAALKSQGDYPTGEPGAGPSQAAASGGLGVTVQALAAAKKLPTEFLAELGCRDDEHRGAPAVAIPYRDAGGAVMFERKRLTLAAKGRRFWQPAGVAVAPYGLDRLEEARKLGRILLVEGESDCWAVWRHREAALGLPGKGTWRPEWAEHLAGLAEVYLWQEPDAADLTERVARDLPAVRIIQAPEGIKDVAEAHAGGLDLWSWLARLRTDAATAAAGQAELDVLGPRPWPSPLAAAAFHGLAGDVVQAIEPHTEADPAGLLLQFLIAFGVAIDRGPHFWADGARHGLNEFGVVVGDTSKARKGSGLARIRNLFDVTIPEWTGTRLVSGLSTGEGLIHQVRDPMEKPGANGQMELIDAGVEDKRLLVLEPELASVLRRMEREANSLSPVLREAWDGRDLGTLTKHSPSRASGAHIGVIGQITQEELTRYLTRTEAANGLGNRFLWFCVRRSKELPRGGGKPSHGNLPLRLREAIARAATLREIVLGDEAGAVWDHVYGPLSEGKLGLFGALIARSEAHVMRLATTYAVLDGETLIAPEHLLAALAVWDYAEASASYLFGEALGDPDAEEVISALAAAGDAGLTRNELRDHFNRHLPSDRLSRAVTTLASRGLVTVEQQGTGGRPVTRYRVRQRSRRRTDSYLALARQTHPCAVRAESAKSPERTDSQFSDPPSKAFEACAESPSEVGPTNPAPPPPGLSAQPLGTALEPDSNSDSGSEPLSALSALTAQGGSPGDNPDGEADAAQQGAESTAKDAAGGDWEVQL